MGERGVTYGLKYQARCLAAVESDNKKSRWLVGTSCLREYNEVQLLEFDAERDAVRLVASFPHEHEIWEVVPCPTDPSKLLTTRNKGGTYSALLWQLGTENEPLQELAELSGHTGVIRRVAWCEQNQQALVSLEEAHIRCWSLREGSVQMTAESCPGDMSQLWAGCWNPHDAQSFLTTGASNVQVWDLRSLKVTSEIQAAHSAPVRDVDAARQHQHLIVTAGDDSKVRYWDLRHVTKTRPLLESSAHRHWVWQARFSPTHDQLVLSCSSDSLVSLMYAPGLLAPDKGAAPRGAGAPSAPAGPLETASKSFDDHEESVYGVAWSKADPWVFASLSYDGRLVLNQVPGQIKYKILI